MVDDGGCQLQHLAAEERYASVLAATGAAMVATAAMAMAEAALAGEIAGEELKAAASATEIPSPCFEPTLGVR